MNRPPEQGREAPSANARGHDRAASGQDDFIVEAPSICLPKGGGPIRSIGERFAIRLRNRQRAAILVTYSV